MIQRLDDACDDVMDTGEGDTNTTDTQPQQQQPSSDQCRVLANMAAASLSSAPPPLLANVLLPDSSMFSHNIVTIVTNSRNHDLLCHHLDMD